jgi:hypothetical protein
MRPDPSEAPNPYEKPAHADEPEPPRAPTPKGREPAGLARRIAGGMMLANGVLVILEVALTPALNTPAAGPTGSPVVSGVSSLLDIGIGISLLTGSSALATFAIVRSALGLTAGLAMRAGEGPIGMATQAIMCLSLLGLLIGKAERVRTAISASAMGLYLAVQMLAIASLVTGTNPLAPALLASAGDIEGSPVTRATGIRVPYEISFSSGDWYPRKPERFAKEYPLVDRWFVHPKSDVHVLVIVEHAPDKHFPIDAFADVVIDNTKKETPSLAVASREPWPLHPERGRLVKALGTREGVPFEWRFAFLSTYERAVYVLTVGSTQAIAPMDAELRAIVDSFRLPPGVLDALPADLVPGPAGKVAGGLMPYSITGPNAEWHVRRPESFKAQNADIDRWLTRRDYDAHVIVVAEEMPPGIELPLDNYVEAVIGALKTGASRFELVSREPWAKHPQAGVRLRVSLTRQEVELEYDCGIFARKSRGFQVQAFAPKATFAAASADLAKVVDSFDPPP